MKRSLPLEILKKLRQGQDVSLIELLIVLESAEKFVKPLNLNKKQKKGWL